MAYLKLAFLLIIIDVSWVARAFKGARVFITKAFPLNAGLQDDKAREIVSRLRAGKRYLSTDFKLYITSETPCADNCSVYALSSDEAEYRETCSH